MDTSLKLSHIELYSGLFAVVSYNSVLYRIQELVALRDEYMP